MVRDDEDRGSPFCSELTRAAGEPMIGSAPKDGRNIVAIAYDGAWAKDPLPASTLSDVAKNALDVLVKSVPRTRIVFVRRAGESTRPTVLLAHAADPSRPVLRFSLDSYDELATLDLASVIATGSHPRATRLAKPVVLVCGHGKRDRCCARLGTPIYEALLGDARVDLWISSHLGGHRFAPILLSLPDGHSYGRMTVEELPAFIDALLEGRIHDLSKLRGRAGLDEPVQAAEALVRLRDGFDRHDAVRALESKSGADATHVRLATPRGEIEVMVRKRPLSALRPTSCGDEPSPAFVYELA